MKKVYSITATLIFTLTVLLSGCKTTPSQEAEIEKPNVSQNEKKEISLYLGEANSYDPAYAFDSYFINVGQSIYEGLVRFKRTSTQIEPCLATKWDISPEMKEYTFHLRDDVTFHDGSQFNADSVLVTFNRLMSEENKYDMPYASFVVDEIEDIVKVDDYTVKFILYKPSVVFLNNLAMHLATPIVGVDALEKYADEFGQNPVGTGPYKVLEYKQGEVMKLGVNENYWGEKPNIDVVNILLEEKPSPDQISDFSNGKVDILEIANPTDINKIPQNKASIARYDQQSTYFISFNTSKELFNNVNYRKGISHLINRDEIIKEGGEISGKKAETLIPPSVLGYNSKVKAPEYDLSKANELLKDFPKDREILLIYLYDDVLARIAGMLEQDLLKVGLKAKVEGIVDYDEYLTRIEEGTMDMELAAWASDNGDPDNFMFLFHSESIDTLFNTAKYENSDFDELLNEGKSIIEDQNRARIYQSAEEILSQDIPVLPLFHGERIYAYSNDIKNFYIHPKGGYTFRYFDKK